MENKKLHIASCGTGIDLYYINKISTSISNVFVSDISEKAVDTTLKINSSIAKNGKVEDNEKLSFPDNYFDYSFIAAALHHLPRPHLGLFELLRVSKQGVIVIEPNDSLLTKLATKLKYAQEYESYGNYVFRYSKSDVEKISNSLFYKSCSLTFYYT